MELNWAEQIQEDGSELLQLSMSGELLILVCFYIFLNFFSIFPYHFNAARKVKREQNGWISHQKKKKKIALRNWGKFFQN